MNMKHYYFRYNVIQALIAAFCLIGSINVFAETTGSFRVPTNNQLFDRNIMVGGSVSNPDGLGTVIIRIDGDATKEISPCGTCSNSTTTLNFVRAGINPRSLELLPGSHQAQLIEVNNGNEILVDTVNFSWNPPVVGGVSVNRTFGSIAINWNTVSGYTRYNLYIASEPNITPENINSLSNSITFIGISGTSQTVNGFADELGLFGLITASNTGGEGAYSEVFRIEALDNQDPTVISEQFNLDEDTNIQGNILSNDIDPEGQPISAELVAQPLNGVVTLDGEGNFSYTPNANFNGTDRFNYTVSDPQGGSGLGNVTFSIVPVNDLPQAGEDVYETSEDAALSVTADQGLLSNDSDIDNDPLQAQLATQASNGSVTISGDGSFTYQPDDKFFGVDTFQYTVSDGQGGSQTGNVSINVLQVNDLPIASDDQYETGEDVLLTTNVTTGVLSNDTDEDAFDGDIAAELTVSLLTDVANGTLLLSSDGSFSYSPATHFFGSDSFTYLVTDSGGQTDTATAFISILSINDAPVATTDSYEISEDSELTVSAALGVIANDSDVEDGVANLTASLVTTTSQGSLQLNSDGSFTYIPINNFFGSDSFVYQLTDTDLATSDQTVTLSILPVNDAPVAVDDEFALLEDQTFVLTDVNSGLLANDSDADLSNETRFTALTASLITSPDSGTLQLESNGLFSFTPIANFNGQLFFTYQISDEAGATAQATVTLNVADTPDVPVAADDSYSTAEDQVLSISSLDGVLNNDTDPVDSALSVSVLESTQSGSLNLNADGSFTYQPDENFFGSDGFSYQITNDSQLSATANVTLSVSAVNDFPVVNNDEFSINENETTEFDPVVNDTDIDGDPLSLVSAQPLLGSLNINGNTIIYTAPATQAGENAVDTISYTISDGSDVTSSGLIQVTILNVNNAPVAENDSGETEEDTQVTLSPLDNDSDVDGDALSLTITATSNGSATVSGNNVIFSPDENFNGNAEINYTIADPQGATANAIINVVVTPVNDLPVAQNDTFTLNEGATISFSPLTNDSDIEDTQLTIIQATSLLGAVTHTETEIEYTAPVAPGTDIISYSIADSQGGTASATITVNISDINNTPVANDDTATTSEDTAVDISVLDNDTDADNDSLTVSVTSVLNGTAVVSNNGVITYTPSNHFFGTGTIQYAITDITGESDNAQVTVIVTAVNDAPVAQDDSFTLNEGATFTFSPLTNDTDVEDTTLSITAVTAIAGTVSHDGTNITYTAPLAITSDTLTYVISDSENATDSATIAVTINDINHAPDAVNDSATTAEDSAIDIAVLGNDTDTDGDTLTVTTSFANNGTTSVSATGGITYTPNLNFFGSDTINYTVSDGAGGSDSAVVAINVTPVNDAPVAQNDSFTLDEGATTTFSPLTNDSDVEDSDLTITSATSVAGSVSHDGTNITYTAPLAQTSDTITYEISDSEGATATATVTVTIGDINHTPDAVDDTANTTEDTAVTISVLTNDTDTDGDTLTVISSSANNGSTSVTATQEITYTPNLNYHGADTINYTVDDGAGGTDNAVVVMTVTSVNDAPVAENDSLTIDEGATVTFSPLSNDSDVEDSNLTITSTTSVAGTVTHDGANITYTAPLAQTSDTITYAISDSEGATATATVAVTISDINHTPDAVDDSASTAEDTAVTIAVLANDTDIDGDTLTVSVTSVLNGSTSVSADGAIIYTPNTDFFGTDTIQYSIADMTNASDSAQVTVTVIAVNDLPIAADDTATVNEGQSVNITVLSNDTDVDGDTLTISSVSVTTGTVNTASDALSLDYTAPVGFSGTTTISYFVSDGTAVSASAGTVTVTVNDINHTPVAVADTYDVFAGETNTLAVLTNDTDTDGDTLTITTATTTLGTVSISTDASSLSYVAPTDTTGTATISYTITDPSGATASTTATVNITEQSLTGTFDPDGDGTSDITATTTGTNHTVTFGSNVSSVYYTDGGETVAVSANSNGDFEITIAGTAAAKKSQRIRTLRSGVRVSVANNNFTLPSTTNQVFFTINGIEHSFTVTNLNLTTPNIAFGPPTQLNSNFSGISSHDFFLRESSFSGPLRFGVTNGEHYVLNADNSGVVRGANYDQSVTWTESAGRIEITITTPQEQSTILDVYDIDDDISDGLAVGIITKAEADAYVAAYNTTFVEAHVADLRQSFTLVNDNKVHIDANIERFVSVRISSADYPEISSANTAVTPTQAFDVMAKELWDISVLKIHDINFSDLSADIATDIPRIQNNTFDSFAADICTFIEDSVTSNMGTGNCQKSTQNFTWQISNRVLSLDFGSDVVANYRWIDKLATENTFAIEARVGAGSAQQVYSLHAYWLPLESISDTAISSLITGNYFDSAIAKTDPGARDSSNNINTSDIFGFYFDSSGLAKNILSVNQFTGDQLFDLDQRWQLSSGDIKISSLSSVSNPGATFRYFYDQCVDTADENCFAWEFREWQVITVDSGKLWVWETVLQNQDGPNFNSGINYFEYVPPRIQFYEFNNTVPGAPNSISFNQEPNWNPAVLQTEFNTPLSNVDLGVYVIDPESDPLTIQDVIVDSGTMVINTDNSVTYTPVTGFSGNVNFAYSVSDGTNMIYAFGVITVLNANTTPVALDDAATALTGFPTVISPLANDTDADSDPLIITSATATNGTVTLSSDQSFVTYTSNTGFTGTDTIVYDISDGRTNGTATANVTVTVSSPAFSGNYDIDNSGDPDFNISTNGTTFTVLFSGEVDAAYYSVNGSVFPLTENADGFFEFHYQSGATTIPTLTYSILGTQYTMSPDNLTLTSPALVYGGAITSSIDFGQQASYEIITRHSVTKAALATGRENGSAYSLLAGGTGQYSASNLSDTVTWGQGPDGVTVTFTNPQEVVTFYSVYDLDDDNTDGFALNVISKAEADAYVAANNTQFVDVYESTLAHVISANVNHGYYHQAYVDYTLQLRIDSASHPEITSASNGVTIVSPGDLIDIFDTTKFNFLSFSSSQILGQVYLPIPLINRSATDIRFSSDSCILSETSTGSNSGNGSCSLSGIAFTWTLNSDGTLDITLSNNSGVTASYFFFSDGNVEKTVYVEATDINSKRFSTLDYWFSTPSVSNTAITTLLSGNYMENSDSITNVNNYDTSGVLNSNIGDGFYLDASGLAKYLRTSIDPDNNNTLHEDSDRRWNIANAVVDITTQSNLSSGDTYQYQNSQCSNSNDQSCYIWAYTNWQTLAIDGSRIWVLDTDYDDGSDGFFGGLPISYAIINNPKIRFFDVRTPAPGAPNSISFNQEPVLFNPNFDAVANTATTLNVLSAIGDPESDTVTLTEIKVDNGTATINGDSSVTYTATNGFIGTTFIDIKVSDGINEVTLFGVINVSPANIPPVAQNDTESAIGGHNYTFNVLDNDTDADSDPLTITAISTLASGFSIAAGNTAIEYSAPATLTATPTVNYTISDGNGGTTTATLTVNLVPNSAPVVVDDIVSVNAGNNITITPLVNDSDANGDALAINTATSTDGTIVIANDKLSLNFTPTITKGAATIAYSATDNFGGDTAGTITVVVNSIPIANNDTESAVGSHNYVFSVLSNDTDGDFDTLTITSITTTANGFTIDSSNTNIEYTAPASLTATPLVTYNISDGNGGTSTAVLTVNLVPNSSPVVQNDTSTVNAGSLVKISPLSNDSDPDGDTIEIGTATSPDGTIVIASDKLSLDFTPTITIGTATINYSANDSFGGNGNGTISVTVNALNTPPVANNDNGNAVGSHTYAFNVLSNDTDADSDTLTITNIATSDSGFSIGTGSTILNYNAPAALTATPTVTYTISDGNGGTDTAVLTVNLTPNSAPIVQNDTSSVNAGSSVTITPLSNDSDPDGDTIEIGSATSPDGSITLATDKLSLDFTPSITSGTATINYSAIDAYGGNTNGTISVTVNIVNSAPVANNDNENAVGGHTYAFNVLSNDTDADSDTLTITNIATSDSGFSIGTGSTILNYNAPASLTATPTVTYTISDGNGGIDTALLTVNLTPNNAPIVQNDTSSVNAGSSVTITPLSNDSDPDGDTIEIGTATSPDGTITLASDKLSLDFTPTIASGTATINYSAIDAYGGNTNGTISVTVNIVNTAPVAVDDTLNTTPLTMVNFDPRTNDTDADSDQITIQSATAINGSVTLGAGGLSLDYTSPSTGHTDTITYVISDGNGGNDSGMVNVSINTLPIASVSNEVVAPSSVTAFTPSVSDADGDTFTVTAASATSGSVTFSGTNVTYTAPAAETSDTVSYTVSDGFGGTASSTISVTINHAPVGNADSYTLSRNGTTNQFTNVIYVPVESGVINNDTDASSGDSHTVSVVTAPLYASSFTLNSDGSFQYQHNGSNNYSDSFTYNLSDGAQTIGPVTASLTIVKENWAPRVCTFPRRYVPAGEVLNQEIRVADEDGDAQSFSISGNPSWMQINIDGSDTKKAFITSTETGGLVPTSAIGTTYNLTVSSSDGFNSTSRSFDMTISSQFGTSNVFEQAFGGTVETVHDATIDSRGRIVYVGSSDGDVAIARILSTGVFDTNFNSGSPVILNIGGTNDVAMAVTTTPGGEIYIGGSTNADTDADSLIIALNEDGSVNTSFNGGNSDGGTYDASGIEVISDLSLPYTDGIEDIHYLDTGHILIVGYTDNGTTTDLFVAQYNSTGSANTSWDSGDGFITISGSTQLIPRKSRISKEGGLYIVGDALNGSAQDIFITRVLMNGTGQDTAFNGGSIYYIDDTSGNEEANDFAFDLNGNLIIAGKHNGDLALYYRALSGTNDVTISTPATFNSGTDKLVLDLNSGSTDEAYSIVSDKRGNYYVAAKSNADTKVIKIAANGTQDMSYGTSGIKTIGLSSGDSSAETVMLLDARGQLLILDVEDVASDDHIQLTADFILDPPIFGSCATTGTEMAQTATDTTAKSLDTAVVAEQYKDGGYYVAGYSFAAGLSSGNKLVSVAKVENDGSLDTTFADGFVKIDGGSVSSVETRQALTVENDNVLISGVNASTTQFFMAKITASGALDTSFDADGRRDFGGSLDLQPTGMLYDSSLGDYLITGNSSSSVAYVYRFNSDGSDDNNFGAGASSLTSADTGVNYTAYTDANFGASNIYKLSDGNIYVVGEYFVSDKEVAVLQLDSNGLVQTAYGTSGSFGGIVHYSESAVANVIASVDTDGTHFYVLNHNNGGPTSTARIFKIIAATGALDTSYGTNGIVTLSLPDPNTGTLVSSKFDNGHTWSIRVDSAGNQWVMLYADSGLDTVNTISDEPYLIKLNASGKLDPGFANGGYTRLTHGVAGWAKLTGIEVDSASNIFIHGYTNSDFAFALADSNGVINTNTPVTKLDLGDGSHNFDIALDEYSGVNLAGASFDNTDKDANRSLTRFDNTGATDSTFGTVGSSTAIELIKVYTDEVSLLNAITVSTAGNLYHSGSSFPEGGSSDTDLFIGRSAIAGATLDSTGYPGLSNINNTTGIEAVGAQYLADDGSLFVAGSTGTLASVYKYDDTGSMSTSFNNSSTTGYIHIIETGDHHFNDIKPDGKGGFIAVGYITNGGHDSGLIARFTDSNTTALDSGFSGNGVATYDVSSQNERFESVSIGTDGTIYAVGYTNYKALIVAYDATGNLINKFTGSTASHLELDYTGGTTFTGTENIGIQRIVDLETDAYGGLMMLARVENGFSLVRYKSDGTLISNYGGVQKVSPANKLRAMAIDSLGNVYLTGSAHVDSRWVSFVVRFPNAVSPY